LFNGSLHMCRGSSCLLWWFVPFAWAWFCLGCVESLPLPKGSETCLLQLILLFAFSQLLIAYWSFFYSFLFFFFSLWFLYVCVVNAWCTWFENHRSGDGERVLLVSTWVLVTWGGAIL
jgi:hypothetical protein